VTVIVPIQVLRAAAATAVVIGHFQAVTSPTAEYFVPYAKLGSAGVDLFFIISGFVMVYASEPMFGRADGPLNFFARRVIRIVPLYWLATTVYVVVAAAAPSLVEVPYSIEFLVSSYLFIPVARPGGAMNPVVGQGWTLNYEMLFYVIFAIGVLGTRRAAVAVSSLALVGLVAVGRLFEPSSPVLAFWTDSIILEFIYGMVLGLAYREGLRLPKWLSAAVLIAGLALFYVNLEIFEIPRALANGLVIPRSVAYGVPAAVVVAGATLGDFSLKGAGWRMLSVVGDASYALYLFHAFPVRAMIHLFKLIGVEVDAHRFVCLAVTVGVSAVMATIIYYLFERPVTLALRSLVGQFSVLRGIRLEPKIPTKIPTKMVATEIVTKTGPVPPTPTAR
jgi:exopolysaccharide production protein ExoZ